MVTKRIGKASDAPTVALGDGCYLSRPRSDSLSEDRLRVVDRQDHPGSIPRLLQGWSGGVLKPEEVRMADR